MGHLQKQARNDAKPYSKAYVKSLVERRARMLKRRRLPKPKVPLHPKSVEKFYLSELQKIMRELKTVYREIIKPAIPSILAQASDARPTKDSFREDAYSDEIKRVMNKAKLRFEGVIGQHAMKIIADKVAKKVNDFNSRDLDAVFKSVLGVDVFRNEPWLEQEARAFTTQNVGYIKSIPEDYFDRIEHTIFTGARGGWTNSEIAENLQKDYDITENKAAFIARDQVAKFNGALTELRQKEVGVQKYIWQTSEDDRVRPTHAILDQTEHSWDDPPVTNTNGDTNNPGGDYNCRCVAIPVFESSDVIESGQEESEE